MLDPVQLLCRFMRLLPGSWQRLEVETPSAETPVQLSAQKQTLRVITGEREKAEVVRFCGMTELTAGLQRVAAAEGVIVSCSADGHSITLTRCPQAGMQRTVSLMRGPHVCVPESAGSGVD
jgi:hypothetical protein